MNTSEPAFICPAIATRGRHPLPPQIVCFYAAFGMLSRFRYIAHPGGVGGSTAHIQRPGKTILTILVRR